MCVARAEVQLCSGNRFLFFIHLTFSPCSPSLRAPSQTLEECQISAQGEAIVEPITVNFVYKVDGTEDDWEEVHVVEYANPDGEPKDAGEAAAAPAAP